MRQPRPTPPRWGLGDDPLMRSAVRVMQENNHVTSLLSHELNTPLSVIMASLETLYDGRLNQDQVYELHQLVAHHIERLRRNIGRIILFMQLEWENHNGILPPHITADLDLHDLLGISLSMAHEKLSGKAITTETLFAEPLPCLTCCQDRLELCLYELLDNTVKFTPAGGKLVIATHQSENGIRIEFRQSPVQLDPEQLRLFYLPFWQAEELNTRRIDGMGLGIPLIRRLIGSLGGGFAITTAEDGLTFSITLPLDAGALPCT